MLITFHSLPFPYPPRPLPSVLILSLTPYLALFHLHYLTFPPHYATSPPHYLTCPPYLPISLPHLPIPTSPPPPSPSPSSLLPITPPFTFLLHAETDNRHLRLAYLAASSCSMWSTTLQRHSKPFNPLLGETFEYIRPDLGYYCVTEQVSIGGGGVSLSVCLCVCCCCLCCVLCVCVCVYVLEVLTLSPPFLR